MPPARDTRVNHAPDLVHGIVGIYQSPRFEDFRWRILTAEFRELARSRDGVSLLATRDDNPGNTSGRGWRRGDLDAFFQYAWEGAFQAESPDSLELASMGVVWKLQRTNTL